MTTATAPVAVLIIAGRPPATEIVTAMTKLENGPTAGSTPAITENEITSGISASVVTMPASTSVVSSRG